MSDVRLETFGPSGWRIIPDRESIALLKSGALQPLVISVLVPPEEIPGEYEINLRSYTLHAGVRIESDRKTFRIVFKAASSTTSILALILAAVFLLAGVGWLARRLGRR